MRDEPVGPEWAGYVAAFEARIDARKRGDDQLADQARRLMGWFAEELRDAASSHRTTDTELRQSRATIEHNLEPLLEQVGLL